MPQNPTMQMGCVKIVIIPKEGPRRLNTALIMIDQCTLTVFARIAT